MTDAVERARQWRAAWHFRSPFPVDETDWRVYAAEETLHPGYELRPAHRLHHLVRHVVTSSWWSRNFADITRVETRLSRTMQDWPMSVSWTERVDVTDRSAHRLVVHKGATFEAVVVHELAHMITPAWVQRPGDPAGVAEADRRRGAPADLPSRFGVPVDAHGALFAASHLLMARHVLGPTHAGLLADAYRHFEVPVASDDERAAAYADEPGLIDAMRRRCAFFGLPMPTEPGRPILVPGEFLSWGEVFQAAWRALGRDRKRISKKAMSALIAEVTPCTPRDLLALERLDDPPTGHRLRRVALAAVALTDNDPVWVSTSLGIDAGAWGVDLGELEPVASTWVARVRHLLDLQRSRPPRWILDGAR